MERVESSPVDSVNFFLLKKKTQTKFEEQIRVIRSETVVWR